MDTNDLDDIIKQFDLTETEYLAQEQQNTHSFKCTGMFSHIVDTEQVSTNQHAFKSY